MNKKQTISVLVKDKPGVLQRVCGLFSRRAFNIASITVGHSERVGLSRMIFVTSGDERKLQQIKKQLYKLIDVIEVTHLQNEEMVARELALIKVHMQVDQREDLLQLIETHRGLIVDIHAHHIIVQLVGDRPQIDQFLQQLSPFGIMQISRTGTTAMGRGTDEDVTDEELYTAEA